MEVDKIPDQQNSIIKPVIDYLINGPIPAEELAYLEFIPAYLDISLMEAVLTVNSMLEAIVTKGAPDWWKGTIDEFEEEFHNNYHLFDNKMVLHSDFIWRAAEDEVRKERLPPLPDDATKEQVNIYLTQGKKRAIQILAVEILLSMWAEAEE